MSRWDTTNAAAKRMRLPYFTTHQKLPYMCFSSKNQWLPVFIVFSVILRLGSNFQYAILLIFVWWFVFNPPRVPIHTPSCVYMHLKWSDTEITSKNAKISTLHPNNFFMAGFCYTILYETYLIPIYSFYWKFAPILRSQKKVDFLWTGSTFTPTLVVLKCTEVYILLWVYLRS